MTPLTESQIEEIAREVALQISGSGKLREKNDPRKDNKGIFSTIDEAVSAAKTAHEKLTGLSVERREKIILSIRKKMIEYAERLAVAAFKETGLGRPEDKFKKNILVAEKTPGIEILKADAVTGDHGLTLVERAPYGVIGAITPSTNPTSTIICNSIGMIAAGNTVVFNAHPSAKTSSEMTIKLINDEVISAGGPENTITAVNEPTIKTAAEIMAHKGISLLVVTGGEAVVRAAMQSGKRAICAGPGNPPVIVDETADIRHAATSIINGASLDNNIICVLEKEIIVVNEVREKLILELKNQGAFILEPDQIRKLEKIIFLETSGPKKPGKINKEFVGKNISVILKKIGIEISDSTRLAIAPVDESHPLIWTEQLMPVIPLVGVSDCDSAIELAVKAEHGFRHTAVMHSKNIDRLSRMAKEINSSIFVKNGPSYAGLGFGGEGFCSFSIASPTGEGLTSPISFTRLRRCVLVDHFRII